MSFLHSTDDAHWMKRALESIISRTSSKSLDGQRKFFIGTRHYAHFTSSGCRCKRRNVHTRQIYRHSKFPNDSLRFARNAFTVTRACNRLQDLSWTKCRSFHAPISLRHWWSSRERYLAYLHRTHKRFMVSREIDCYLCRMALQNVTSVSKSFALRSRILKSKLVFRAATSYVIIW